MTAVPVRWLTVFLDFPAGLLDAGGLWDLVVAAVAALG